MVAHSVRFLSSIYHILLVHSASYICQDILLTKYVIDTFIKSVSVNSGYFRLVTLSALVCKQLGGRWQWQRPNRIGVKFCSVHPLYLASYFVKQTVAFSPVFNLKNCNTCIIYLQVFRQNLQEMQLYIHTIRFETKSTSEQLRPCSTFASFLPFRFPPTFSLPFFLCRYQ